YLDKTPYHLLSSSDLGLIESLFNKSWKDLIGFIKSKKIEIYQFKMRKQVASLTDADLIPNKLLSSLPEPTRPNLLSLLNYSKINEDFVVGKYLCTSVDGK